MILAILQARMSSSRLPGKVLRPLAGVPMIGRQIARLSACETLDRLVVATSLDASDDPLAAYVEGLGVRVFRGSLPDVLGRFAGAALAQGPADHVVRLTGDCPFSEARVIDACVRLHLSEGSDYTSNTLQRTFPDGLDVEVMTGEVLARAQAQAQDPYEREHVTPWIYREPGRCRIAQLTQAVDRSALRWTVDTEADFDFADRIFAALDGSGPDFGQDAILTLPFGWREAA